MGIKTIVAWARPSSICNGRYRLENRSAPSSLEKGQLCLGKVTVAWKRLSTVGKSHRRLKRRPSTLGKSHRHLKRRPSTLGKSHRRFLRKPSTLGKSHRRLKRRPSIHGKSHRGLKRPSTLGKATIAWKRP